MANQLEALKAIRTPLLLTMFLLSSLLLVAQSGESSAPSSGSPQSDRHSPPAPLEQRCGFISTPEAGKAPPGKVSGGKLIHSVPPEYPAAARKAHIQGTVVLCAKIAKDGKIRSIRPISGPEELIPYAMKAAEQWRYQPYLKDNEPVEVDSEIHLGFKL